MSQLHGAKNKGYIKNLDNDNIMPFQFNPETFEYSRGVTYNDIVSPGMPYPNTQYAHGNVRSFPVQLFLYDKPSTGLIENFRNFIEAFLTPETNPSSYKKPPEMLFCYAYFIKRCVLEDLSIIDEEFDELGNPTMSRYTLTLRQVGV